MSAHGPFRSTGRRLRRGVAAAALAGAATLLGGCTQEAASEAKPEAPRPRPHLVELTGVSLETLRSTSVYTGSLRYRQSVRVFNQEEGRVVALPWFEGDRVTRGEVLFELDAALLAAELKKARAMRREAEANLERAKGLLSRRMISEEDHLRAATALEVAHAEEAVLLTRLGYARGIAPFDGIVAERLIEPGDIVPRHTHMLTLVDPSSLVAELGVSELVIPHLRIGDPVGVRIDALGDAGYPGRVLRIHPELDARTRQGIVEVLLEPVPDGARAGLFARVSFEIRALERRVVPFAALRRDREGEHVFRVDDDGTASRVAVRGGRRLSDRIEILEGLEVGDRVIVKGFLGLQDGKKVTPVKQRAGGSEASERSRA